MKKAVVLGASGGMGFSLVNELVSRGIDTTAFARSAEKLEALFAHQSLVTIKSGDVFKLNDLIGACEGVDVIFHSINIPYPEWKEKQPKLMANVLEAARQVSAKLFIVDNIYSYGRSPGQSVTEMTPKQPHTKKGKIRLQLEQMAFAAHEQGVPVILAHFPDFYGPNAGQTLLHVTLEAMHAKKTARFIGDPSLEREYIFTPDGAKAAVELALHPEAYGQVWNIPGHSTISGDDLMEIMRSLTGYKGKVGTVGKGTIGLLGLFNRYMREFYEMMYLNEEPVVLSGVKYERLIGPLPRTSYEEGLAKTVAFLETRKG
ncbi:NAD-dependent epimerase/dehydratase family protein [Brevibacillus migulae]|uniref:NAD-dependent epimerase/dehydratase family protein n=1 Tax=Brevibacillus migulae TaxID=1644114 RepID=UPI00106EE36F|nr:NAD-dependent epimerase/dehydratase family protein [Brevibacillus migulae]